MKNATIYAHPTDLKFKFDNIAKQNVFKDFKKNVMYNVFGTVTR